MRIRSIKPEFFKDSLTGRLSTPAKLLYIGLWCFADDAGRFEWEPELIRAELFPYDPRFDLDAALKELEKHGRIVAYGAKGRRYGEIPEFHKHQHPRRPQSSIIPPRGDIVRHCPDSDGHCPDACGHCPDACGHCPPGEEGRGEEVSSADAPDAPAPTPVSPEAENLAEHLLASILSHKPDFKYTSAKVHGWAEDIDLALRIDGRTPARVRELIDYAHRDPRGSFWRPNVLSGSKLRKQYDTLDMQERERRGRSAPAAGDDESSLFAGLVAHNLGARR